MAAAAGDIVKLIYAFIICLVLKFLFTQSVPESALVTAVPGFDGNLPSDHYSGYVTIDKSHGKKLFYYFVVSERNRSSDPVVLWLNGVPGCSSLDGFVYEHGPFNFEAGTTADSLPTLHLNPYSWTKVSNIIYLGSPAGVGLSYSGNTTDYVTGDIKTASDSRTFLLKWFELYPEFLPNPFYIVGESYAGVYVPTLSYEVVKGIDAGLNPVLNFKGYMVGNGVTDREFDGNAFVPFAHGMGLISDDLFGAVEGVNIFDILKPCYHYTNNNNTKLPPSFRMLGQTERPLPVRARMFGRAWPLRDGISDEVATAWLDNEAVRKAIHAESLNVVGSWEMCTDRTTFHHDAGSMIKYHKNLTSKGYGALIFSGDHDMCVPFTGNQAWTRSMGFKIVDEWRPWNVDNQVAGYLQGYDYNLTFLTIKGAGHTVPEYKPREALAFYTRWLDGKKI